MEPRLITDPERESIRTKIALNRPITTREAQLLLGHIDLLEAQILRGQPSQGVVCSLEQPC